VGVLLQGFRGIDAPGPLSS